MPERRRWWRSPVRWGILAGVVAGILVLVRMVVDTDQVDALIPVLVGAGGAAGLFAGVRIVAMPFGGAGDPRLGRDPQSAIWAGFAQITRDGGFAVAWGLLGGLAVGIGAFVAEGARTAESILAPFLIAPFWWMGYLLVLLAIAFVWIPASVFWRGWRRRGTERTPHRAWFVVAGVFAVVDIVLFGGAVLGLVRASA